MYGNAVEVTAYLMPVGDLPFTPLYPPHPPAPPSPPLCGPPTHHPDLDASASESILGLQAL